MQLHSLAWVSHPSSGHHWVSYHIQWVGEVRQDIFSGGSNTLFSSGPDLGLADRRFFDGPREALAESSTPQDGSVKPLPVHKHQAYGIMCMGWQDFDGAHFGEWTAPSKIRRETPQTHVQQAETNLHNNTHVVAEFALQFFVCCMAVLCRERGLAQEKRRKCAGIAQGIRNKCTATFWVLQCSFASAGPRLAGRPTHVFSL